MSLGLPGTKAPQRYIAARLLATGARTFEKSPQRHFALRSQRNRHLAFLPKTRGSIPPLSLPPNSSNLSPTAPSGIPRHAKSFHRRPHRLAPPASETLHSRGAPSERTTNHSPPVTSSRTLSCTTPTSVSSLLRNARGAGSPAPSSQAKHPPANRGCRPCAEARTAPESSFR